MPYKGNKKRWLFFIKGVATFVIIFYLMNSIGLLEIYETLSGGNVKYLIIACLFAPIFILIKTIKWHLMVRSAGASESYVTSLNAVLIGMGFGLFTPGRAGEILRANYYKDVSKVMVGSLVVVDRFIDLIMVIYLGLYFVLIQFGLFATVIVFVLNTSLFILLKYLVNIYKIIPIKWRTTNVYKIFEKIGYCSDVLTISNLAIFCGISLINWLIAVVQFYYLINMYSLTEFGTILASMPVIQLGNLLPITIGGVGVREWLAVLVMSLYSISEQVAAIGAFSLFILDGMIPGIIGLILYSARKN